MNSKWLLMACCLTAAALGFQTEGAAEKGPLVQVFKAVSQAVVFVTDNQQKVSGSGFLFDDQGHVFTNNHVVEGLNSGEIRVLFPEVPQPIKAKIEMTYPDADLAVLKIVPPPNLQPLRLGDSEALEIGESLLVIGAPITLKQTATSGILSAKGRKIGSQKIQDFFQTDAAINPGNSGGPVFNSAGEVVGIATAKVSAPGLEGLGFFIPINLALNVYHRGAAPAGRALAPKTGWLWFAGGRGCRVTPEGIVLYAESESALQNGDLLLRADGKEFSTPLDLGYYLAYHSLETPVELKIKRQAEVLILQVPLQKISSSISSQYPPFGIQVEKVPDGIRITEVAVGSPAFIGDLQNGDLIRQIAKRRVLTYSDYQREIERIDKKTTSGVEIVVIRQNRELIKIIHLQ